MPVEWSQLVFHPISDIELLRSPFLSNGYSGIVSHHESYPFAFGYNDLASQNAPAI
jgi:hypothetical protein